MARTAMIGWELQSLREGMGVGLFGTGAIETTIVRSGQASWKCAPASAGSARYAPTVDPPTGEYHRFYVRVTVLPTSTARMLWGPTEAATRLVLRTNGKLDFYNAANSLLGTSTTALTDTTKWYRIEVRINSGAGLTQLLIDGATEVTGTGTATGSGVVCGCGDSVADTFTAYFDDYVIDDAAFPGAGNLVLLNPISDNAGGAGWTLGTGTALGGNGFAAIDNKPPQGVADLAAGSDPKQIRNASSNANSNMDVNLTTYTTAGVGASDTINAVMPIVYTAAPVTTSSKKGTIGIVSNPTIANVALAAEGVAGAFWGGAAGGTFNAGWKYSKGTVTASPSVTLGTSPVLRVTQVTSSTRIAVVCSAGLYVDYTPAAVVAVRGTIRSVRQAVNRSASY